MSTRSSAGYGKSPISGGKVLFTQFSAIDEFYRTMNVLLLLDSAFGIFDNIQPRIDLCELDLQLPCNSIYFETANYREMAIMSLFPPRKVKLLDAYQKLFMEPTGDSGFSDTPEKISLNSWDLLVLIHRRCSCLFPIMSQLLHDHDVFLTRSSPIVLYSFVWRQIFSNPLLRISSTTVSPSATILDPLKLATRNWKMFWDEARASISPKDLPQMGFETSADSYWTLTRLLVHCFETKGSGRADAGTSVGKRNLDFMPIESDCRNQGSHLRKILRESGIDLGSMAA
jgi:hypothetical protein